ncbi:MAG: hypothetical protein HOY76_20660 [Streptomyces sp.]|nr:hypothetical protein [Streptomyces sp.]NUS11843.1 hypothetical protein [Streptomyces sp.]
MSVRITIDMFSGRPNPSWTVQDPDAISELLRLFHRHRAGIAEPFTGFTGLGFRGIRVEVTDDVGLPGLPRVFEVAGGGADDPFASGELAERLLETMPDEAAPPLTESPDQGGGGADVVREAVRKAIQGSVRRAVDGTTGFEPPEQPPDEALAAEVQEQLDEITYRTADCAWDSAVYQPDFWLDPSVCLSNNCYNYAINVVTNTRAQPGRAHGFTLSPGFSNSEVRIGAQQDGVHVRGDCQPPGTRRYWLAMLTGYSAEGFRDFHWYRYNYEGFWSHKPGLDVVRNFDNSGVVITNPQTSNNGGYTEWGGIFLSHDWVTIA